MKIKILFILFSISNLTLSFTLNNNQNLAFKNSEVNVYLASGLCQNLGLNDDELLELITRANNQYWNKVSTSKLKLINGGLVSIGSDYRTEELCTGSTSNCNVNPVFNFSRGIVIACNAETSSNFPNQSILAVTVPVSFSNGSMTGSVLLLNDTPQTIIDTKSKDEVIALLAHEIGHAIGLGHSPVVDSLMYYQSIPTRRSLGWDDIDGVTYLYPKDQPASCGAVINKHKKNDHLFQMVISFLFILFGVKFYNKWSKRFEGIFNK